MKNFEAYFKANKKSIMAFAEKNTRYNAKGQPTISRNDDWFYDDVWERDYKELTRAEQDKRSNLSAIS